MNPSLVFVVLKQTYIKQIQGLHIFVDKESKHYTNLQGFTAIL